MKRFVLVLPLMAAVVLPGSISRAQTMNDEQCKATADIVAVAVEQRTDGKKAKKVKRGLTKGNTAVDEVFHPAVGPLVDWVFTLDEADLTPDVAVAYEKQCMEAQQ